jgi:general stress protein 26
MTTQHFATESSPEATAHVLELLPEFDTAMLVTRSRNGRLHGRPMAIAKVEEDGTLWFVTDIDTGKVDEIQDDARAMVSLQSRTRFVTLNGNLETIHDTAKARELWKESFRVWFRDASAPELVLLRFTPWDAEYWDNSGTGGLKYALRAAKAYLQGKPLERLDDPDLHGKVEAGTSH